AVHLEPATVTHEMESGARKFVRDGLERHHPRLAHSVALIPGLYGRGEPDCEVGRFDPRPGQVAVSAFSVAGALALAVGDFVGRHQPAVGGVLTDVIEALDLATLKRDRQAEDDPDAWNRPQRREVLALASVLGEPVLDRMDALLQRQPALQQV